MDFKVKKPLHLLALIFLTISIGILIILPLFSFFLFPNATSINNLPEMSTPMKIVFELILLRVQLLFAIGLMIIVPVIWYILVNRYTVKEILRRLHLHLKGIDRAILYGMLTVILCFMLIFLIDIVLMQLGYNLNESSNIKDLEQLFSPPSMFLLLTIQPIAEEIFFRGFLLEKLQSLAGVKVAIVTTAILFGLAHLSYGKIYPAVMTAIVGVILAYVVVKTKNLTTAIIAHILFNVTSFILYLFAQSLPI